MSEGTIGTCRVRVLRDDITALDVEAFAFAARPDLMLGSGFGTAIAQRGGPSVQAELKALAPVETSQAVVTAGGKLKARHIVHVVVPRFQEPELERKLADATRNVLAAAEGRGITRLALPPLGAGFYGVPLETCARVMARAIADHLRAGSNLADVVICVLDPHEIAPFEKELGLVNEPTLTGRAVAPGAGR